MRKFSMTAENMFLCCSLYCIDGAAVAGSCRRYGLEKYIRTIAIQLLVIRLIKHFLKFIYFALYVAFKWNTGKGGWKIIRDVSDRSSTQCSYF